MINRNLEHKCDNCSHRHYQTRNKDGRVIGLICMTCTNQAYDVREFCKYWSKLPVKIIHI